MFQKLQKYAENEDFNPARISKVSAAAGELSKWVLAIYNFHQVRFEATPEGQLQKIIKETCAASVEMELQKQKKKAAAEMKNDLMAMLMDEIGDNVNWETEILYDRYAEWAS